jgi:hypothetical protein
MADPEPMPSRLIRGCIALAFTACVLAIACSSHHLADTVKGGQLSYTILAMKREGIMYSSLLQLTGAAMAGPEPMLPRLVRFTRLHRHHTTRVGTRETCVENARSAVCSGVLTASDS